MEDLDNKWILHSGGADCSDSDDNSPATLGLDNMRGVFILVGAGIATFLKGNIVWAFVQSSTQQQSPSLFRRQKSKQNMKIIVD